VQCLGIEIGISGNGSIPRTILSSLRAAFAGLVNRNVRHLVLMFVAIQLVLSPRGADSGASGGDDEPL
jgi:hypothetical protein